MKKQIRVNLTLMLGFLFAFNGIKTNAQICGIVEGLTQITLTQGPNNPYNGYPQVYIPYIPPPSPGISYTAAYYKYESGSWVNIGCVQNLYQAPANTEPPQGMLGFCVNCHVSDFPPIYRITTLDCSGGGGCYNLDTACALTTNNSSNSANWSQRLTWEQYKTPNVFTTGMYIKKPVSLDVDYAFNTQYITIGGAGILTINPGVTFTDNNTISGENSTSSRIVNNGIYTGRGTILDIIFINNGIFSPGENSIWRFSFPHGGFSSGSTAEYKMEAASATSHDQIYALTTAGIAGKLTVSFTNGYLPQVGDSYQFIQASGSISGTFSSVVFPAGYTGTVAYNANNVTVTITGIPPVCAPTPVISGIVNVCRYIGTGIPVTYTATSAGATGFTWVTPPNVTIVSGQGTGSLTVTFQNGFATQSNKQLRVVAAPSCGNSAMTIYYLAAQAPPTPQPITGTSNVCPIVGTAGTYSYTINAVAGAATYNWSAQSGTTSISEPNGTGPNDTTVNVGFASGFTASTISVSATNGCGTSGIRTFMINRVNPSEPGPVTGSTDACPYMSPNGTAATYSITPVANAASYTWIPASGATILTGQGTATITTSYPSNFVSGILSVTASNGCGTSAARTLSINKLNPSAPGGIDIIQAGSCPDRIFTYSLATMPSHSTSVQWTVPTGATIVSGQGTTSITVSYPATAVKGTVTVQGFNNCGSSSVKSTVIKLPACAGGGREMFGQSKGIITGDAMEVKILPNPSVSDFKLEVLTAGKEQINVRILDLQGRELSKFVVQPYQTTTVGSDLRAGAYMVEVRQGKEVKTSKLIKF